jgi:tetratricopeptide (TPR) repeat protein
LSDGNGTTEDQARGGNEILAAMAAETMQTIGGSKRGPQAGSQPGVVVNPWNDEAAAMIKRAQELDPLSSVIGVNVSRMYQQQNNHHASIENSLKIIELDPNFGPAYEYLALSYLKRGRNAEAIAAAERAADLTFGKTR